MNKKDNKKIKNKKNRKEEKNKKEINNFSLKRKTKLIGLICLTIVLIEIIVMLVIHTSRENKITYLDTYYNISNVDDSYYIVAGSSNFKHSRYNEITTYEYTNEEKQETIIAEKAKLVKLDKELNIIFEKTFKSDYDSTFYDVSKVSDGFIAVGSYVYEEKQLSLKTRDGLIAKYDLDGNFLWSKNYQVLGDTEFKKILVVEDGVIVIGQSIYENMEIGNHQNGGGIIVKYDFDGNFVWTNNFGGNKSGIFESIVSVDDGYIVAGKDASNYGMLVKFDKEGNRLWVKNYANTDTFGFSDMKIHDNKLYIASSYNVSNEKDDDNKTIFKYDACIFVYDLNGELLKQITLKGNNDDRFNSLVLLDNKIVAVGYTKSSDIKLDGLKYNKDMTESFIIEYDYDGKMLKNTVYGGKKNEILTDIIISIPDTANTINNTNDYIVVGYSNSRRGILKGNNKDYYSKVLRYSSDLDLVTEK